jgi:hypothetical protein
MFAELEMIPNVGVVSNYVEIYYGQNNKSKSQWLIAQLVERSLPGSNLGTDICLFCY